MVFQSETALGETIETLESSYVDNERELPHRFLVGTPCNSTVSCGPELKCEQGICVHVKLGSPLTVRDGMACLVFFVASAMASAGAIAGGPIFVPVLEVMLNFAVSQAGGVSQSMITGMAVAVSTIAFLRRHPERDRPAVYYEIVTSMVPICLMGTFVGTYVNQVLPGYFTAFVVVVILIYLIITTSMKAISLRRIELHERDVRNTGRSADFDMADVLVSQSSQENASNVNDMRKTSSSEDVASRCGTCEGHAYTTTGSDVNSSQSNYQNDVATIGNTNNVVNSCLSNVQVTRIFAKIPFLGAYLHPPKSSPDIDSMLKTERRRFQWGDLLLLVTTWSFVIVFVALRGGKPRIVSPLGVHLCSWIYWFLLAILELVLLIISSITMLRLHSLHQHRVRLGYVFCRSDVRWTPKTLVFYSIFCFACGLVASWVGISVETLAAGFLLVVLGVDPLVVQLTGGVINLFTSSAIAAESAANGSLAWRYALFYAGFTFLGALVGVWVVGHFIKKYHLKSIIVFCLVFFLAVATGLEIYVAIQTLQDTLKYNKSKFPIGSIC
ncbi:hypothetical protein GpartN1_g6073.t1 [Galdieria partita]|uniref:Sulfite exporter TauE/SafE n=1 Tax=Galdieria partita TaxID=83374 RepID=A0A9C7Q2D8_9RHOD|nr:hypothetical protein GpartN1_g6073.t1 [Galdieria partita]